MVNSKGRHERTEGSARDRLIPITEASRVIQLPNRKIIGERLLENLGGDTFEFLMVDTIMRAENKLRLLAAIKRHLLR